MSVDNLSTLEFMDPVGSAGLESVLDLHLTNEAEFLVGGIKTWLSTNQRILPAKIHRQQQELIRGYGELLSGVIEHDDYPPSTIIPQVVQVRSIVLSHRQAVIEEHFSPYGRSETFSQHDSDKCLTTKLSDKIFLPNAVPESVRTEWARLRLRSLMSSDYSKDLNKDLEQLVQAHNQIIYWHPKKLESPIKPLAVGLLATGIGGIALGAYVTKKIIDR